MKLTRCSHRVFVPGGPDRQCLRAPHGKEVPHEVPADEHEVCRRREAALRDGMISLREEMRRRCYCRETGGGTIYCEWHAEWIPKVARLMERD